MSNALKILIISFFFTSPVIGQIDNSCKIIQFLHKDSIFSENKLTPTYNSRGFYLVKNGVYDFIIDGKKYFQSILLNVNNNTFSIATGWESQEKTEQIYDTLTFSINQKIQIRMVSIHNGVGNIPTRTKLTDYLVSIKDNDEYCKLENSEIISENTKYLGHYYFTLYGLKSIKMIKGKPYFCEQKGDYITFINKKTQEEITVSVEKDGKYLLRRK